MYVCILSIYVCMYLLYMYLSVCMYTAYISVCMYVYCLYLYLYVCISVSMYVCTTPQSYGDICVAVLLQSDTFCCRCRRSCCCWCVVRKGVRVRRATGGTQGCRPLGPDVTITGSLSMGSVQWADLNLYTCVYASCK